MENDFIARSILVGKDGLFAKRGCPGNCQYCRLWTEDGCRVILEAPTVDAVEVVHGRWKNTSYVGVSRCSHCDKPSSTPDCLNVYFDYCPNCGAKMDGDVNGNL